MADEFLCLGCHGLGLIQPIDSMVEYLNANTPKAIHFETVGGADPQLEETAIREKIVAKMAAGARLIFIGHSKGAMLAYYLGYLAALVVAIDPTCWGSNIECMAWTLTPPKPGHWVAPTVRVDRWIHFRQSGYPGGGILTNPGPQREQHFFEDTDHMSIVNDQRTRKIILDAVKGAL